MYICMYIYVMCGGVVCVFIYVQDAGSAYRSIIALPHGVESPLFRIIVSENSKLKQPMVINTEDFGMDDDVLNTIYVYDSLKFPFHRAEQYHQFHIDYEGPTYGENYTKTLREIQIKSGRIDKLSGCLDTNTYLPGLRRVLGSQLDGEEEEEGRKNHRLRGLQKKRKLNSVDMRVCNYMSDIPVIHVN